MQEFTRICNGIQPLNQAVVEQAHAKLDRLIKPIGSLGKLEEIAVQIAGITGRLDNQFNKKCMVVMSADNGVCEEGVSACPPAMTAIQTMNFTKGICGINVLSRHAGMDLRIVDIGINAEIHHPEVLNRKIRKGTMNICKGPAMTRDEAVRAIEVGIEIVGDLVREGYQILGTGEMGIGNTSTSSAVLTAFTGYDTEWTVGKGAGLTEEDFAKKKRCIKQALAMNRPDQNDPIDVLAKVGGLDIAGMVGCYLGAAYYRIPIIIDGFISAAAALTAFRINKLSKEYMLPSHNSAEPGFKLIMRELEMSPLLDLNLRLGEGTGCPLAIPIIEAAAKIITEMATFEEISMSNEFLVDIR